MKNEIELKLMLNESAIQSIKDWISIQPIIKHEKFLLENSYYDNSDRFFSSHEMGLRVRKKDDTFEMTLKTGGKTIGGLHIRPEYNVSLPNANPDLNRLATVGTLPFQADLAQLQASLKTIFKTDFIREKWLVEFDSVAKIEICLDQGQIENPFMKENLCEVELELIEGDLSHLIRLLRTVPLRDGIWFSALSKAERGYLLNDAEKASKNIDLLLNVNFAERAFISIYQIEQFIADYIRRLDYHPELLSKFFEAHQHYDQQLRFKTEISRENWLAVKAFLTGADYFLHNMHALDKICQQHR